MRASIRSVINQGWPLFSLSHLGLRVRNWDGHITLLLPPQFGSQVHFVGFSNPSKLIHWKHEVAGFILALEMWIKKQWCSLTPVTSLFRTDHARTAFPILYQSNSIKPLVTLVPGLRVRFFALFCSFVIDDYSLGKLEAKESFRSKR